MPDRATWVSRPNPRSQNHIHLLRASAKVEQLAVNGWYGPHSGAADPDSFDPRVTTGFLLWGAIRMAPAAHEVVSYLSSRTS
jgi:hypothetical protein